VAIHSILQQVSSSGLSGKQHLYITFDTTFPNVEIPPYLREEYSDEMTIVLQHEFWDLQVNEQDFLVTLCFDHRYETIRIPMSAILTLSDPSENFIIELDPVPIPNNESETSLFHSPSTKTSLDSTKKNDPNVINIDLFRKK
jgi:hypothetical protein